MDTNEANKQIMEIPELNTTFIFSNRPVDIPGDLRPQWRIVLVLLLLKNCCRDNKARFSQLHVLNWGARTEENRNALEQAIAGKIGREALIVRIEPALNRAVDLAICEKLVQRLSGDQVQLTERGQQFVAAVEGVEALLRPERDFMARIRKKVTGSFVDRLFN